MERSVYCYSKNASEMAKHIPRLPCRLKALSWVTNNWALWGTHCVIVSTNSEREMMARIN